MRMLMSGVFTSGKLKLMLPHIVKIGDNFAHYIDKISQECCFKIIEYLFITIVRKVFLFGSLKTFVDYFFEFCLVGLFYWVVCFFILVLWRGSELLKHP